MRSIMRKSAVLLIVLSSGGASCNRKFTSLVHGGLAQQGPSDGIDRIVIMGDSISSDAFNGTYHPDIREVVSALDPGRTLTYVNAAISGGKSIDGVGLIDGLLAANPTAGYFGLAYGRNDVDTTTVAQFKINMQYMIDRTFAAGKVPVIPALVYSLHPAHVGQELFNEAILEIVADNNLPSGPDLWTWFFTHQNELGPDGAHPNSAGAVSINRLWAEAMLPTLQSE